MSDIGSASASTAQDDGAMFDNDGAADYLGCSPGYLHKLRKNGGGPNYYRLFTRKGIRYTRKDLDQWRAKRRYGSTAEYPEAFR